MQLIECVPNFSEGRDPAVIRHITDAISSVEGVRVLNVDPGKATNRTVVTLVGEPAQVVEAAFRGIKAATEVIDMRVHKGEHPRMGATDVCPLIPISNISMEETAEWARRLGERVGTELGIAVYLYEAAQQNPERRNLAVIRAGEYEGFFRKITQPGWQPDYGPAEHHAVFGSTVIGARDFLVAYNVNLNTQSVRRANSVAFDVREAGRTKREGNPITGKVVTDANGNPVTEPGMLKQVKAIGWFIEEYGFAQVSMNLTNINVTPLHVAFDAVCERAQARGMRVTGSELVGLVPLKCLLDAGRHFLAQQQRSTGLPDKELIKVAVQTMGLDQLGPFNPEERIIEYFLKSPKPGKLEGLTLQQFAYETASESTAPGGGSVSAYLGALGAALGTMVANLSAHKKGWDERWHEFSQVAEEGQNLVDDLLKKVDEDTESFQGIMAAFQLPKSTPEEQHARKAAIEAATVHACAVPLSVMKKSLACFGVLEAMAAKGNPNSASDVGVGALAALAAIKGAALNVRINAASLSNDETKEQMLNEAAHILKQGEEAEKRVLDLVEKAL